MREPERAQRQVLSPSTASSASSPRSRKKSAARGTHRGEPEPERGADQSGEPEGGGGMIGNVFGHDEALIDPEVP